MRAVIQRVTQAQVTVQGRRVARIDKGLLVYLGVAKDDTEQDARFIAEKLVHLRVFADEAAKMNRSVQDVGGAILVVSNFTLLGDCRKGRRPSFDAAAGPENAEQLYEQLVEWIRQKNVPVEKGLFGEYMQVESINDGPVTFLLDSRRLF